MPQHPPPAPVPAPPAWPVPVRASAEHLALGLQHQAAHATVRGLAVGPAHQWAGRVRLRLSHQSHALPAADAARLIAWRTAERAARTGQEMLGKALASWSWGCVRRAGCVQLQARHGTARPERSPPLCASRPAAHPPAQCRTSGSTPTPPEDADARRDRRTPGPGYPSAAPPLRAGSRAPGGRCA
jgi:hypothetical protein